MANTYDITLFVRGNMFTCKSITEPVVSVGQSGRIEHVEWTPDPAVTIAFLDWSSVDAMCWKVPAGGPSDPEMIPLPARPPTDKPPDPTDPEPKDAGTSDAA